MFWLLKSSSKIIINSNIICFNLFKIKVNVDSCIMGDYPNFGRFMDGDNFPCKTEPIKSNKLRFMWHGVIAWFIVF